MSLFQKINGFYHLRHPNGKNRSSFRTADTEERMGFNLIRKTGTHRVGRPEACHVRTQTNNHSCAQRTIISALHRRRKQIGRRFERPERVCKTTGSRRVQRPLADFAEPPQSKRCNLLRRNSAVFCDRSVSTSVRSRQRCPADTFGATFR